MTEIPNAQHESCTPAEHSSRHPVCINPLTDPRWERLVENHPSASVFHSLSWLRALQQTYGYQPVVYTTARANEEMIDGLLFLQVKSWLTGRRLVSLPFSDHCEPFVTGMLEFQQLLAAPRHEVRDGNWQYIELRPRSAIYAKGLEDHPEEYFFHTLDLRPELPILFRNLHVDSIRRKIQRAERQGLILEAGNNESLLADFFRLHLATRRRHCLPPHPRKWFWHLLDSFREKAIIRMARRQGSAVAAVLTIETNKSLVYKYGCSDARFHNTGAMPFAFWDMIRDAKQRGFAQIELGRTEIGNQGLITFKERWGASREHLLYARYPQRDQTAASREQRMVHLAKRVFAHCPNSVLTAVGSLLYPHIG